jgi:hypothetical protein
MARKLQLNQGGTTMSGDASTNTAGSSGGVDLEWNRLVEVLTGGSRNQIDARLVWMSASLFAGTESYGDIPPEELRVRVASNVDTLVRGASQRRGPRAEDDLLVIRNNAAARALAGVIIEDFMSVALRYQQMLTGQIADIAREHRISDGTIDEFLQYLDRWSTAITRAQIEGHQEGEIAQRRGQVERANDDLRRLLSGSLLISEVAEIGRFHGLDPGLPYVVVRLRCGDAMRVDDYERRFGVSGAGARVQGFFGMVYGDICGIVSKLPDALEDLRIGASEPQPLWDAAESFRLATRCLEAAEMLGKSGIITLTRLGALAAIASDDEMVQVLRSQYLAPVLALGTAGEAVLETLRSYIQHKCSVSETSKHLFVHANTVRYRVSRFEEITGCDLKETRTLVEVWWILHAWQLRV